MPIYEFFCDECNLRFEKIFYKISDEKKLECPNCGKLSNRVPSIFGHKFSESTKIPKDIDLKVGKDAERRWLEYEDRKKEKEKVREKYGTQRLSRDSEGNYSPVSVTKDDKQVSEKEAVNLRKEMYRDFYKIKNDPDTKKFTPEE